MDHGTIRPIARQHIIFKRHQSRSSRDEIRTHDTHLHIMEVNRKHAKRIA